jgi:CRP-like cAMP-binding protein
VDGFIGALEEEERAALHQRGTRRRFARGAYLFLEGERSDHVIVLLSGQVKVSSFAADGREAVLALRGPGELIGEFASLDAGPRSASVSAVEPVEALVVDAAAFRSFLHEYPRIALMLLQTVVGKLREANRKRAEFATLDVTGRVARRLVELAERIGEPAEEGEGVVVHTPLSQDELASWIGASRKAIVNALGTLRARGWIDTGRRQFIVRDLDALKRRAT